MPKLVLEGNLNDNFGKFLPAPYIEYVYVGESGLEAQLAVYLNVDEEQDIDAYIQYLKDSDLKFYLTGTADADKAAGVIAGTRSIFDTVLYYVWGYSQVNTRIEFSLGDFESDYSVFYTETGQKVVKLALSNLISWPPQTTTYENYFTRNTTFLDDGWSGDLWIFAFSTMRDGVMNLTYNSEEVDDKTGQEARLDLYDVLTSDVSYQHILDNGVLAEKTTRVYYDLQGIAYNMPVIQSLDGTYHKTKNFTLESMAKDFQKMVDFTRENSVQSDALTDMLNQISYIITEYGNDYDVLIRLNDLRKVFPNKIATDPVGKLYRAFRKKILTYNTIAEREDVVVARLVRNPKVIDARESVGTYSQPTDRDEDPESNPDEYFYVKDNLIGVREYIYGGTPTDNLRVAQLRGFFFFDYEKYLREASNLAQLIDVKAYETLFNTKVFYNYLYLGMVTVQRGTGRNDETTISSQMNSNENYRHFDYSNMDYTVYSREDEPSTWREDTYVKFPYTTVGTYDTYDQGAMVPGVAEVEVCGDYLNSYVVLRNADFTKGSDNDGHPYLDGYRLMTYEFSDVIPRVGQTSGDMQSGFDYTISTSIFDRTHLIMSKIIEQYSSVLAEFQTYVEAAAEWCGQNPDGTFNDFFATQMEAQYEGDPAEAPWYKMPVLFCIHSELVERAFDGNYDALKSAARELIAEVSPDGGTYEGLQRFATRVEAFYTSYYSDEMVLDTGE